jgi:hypothetical protein
LANSPANPHPPPQCATSEPRVASSSFTASFDESSADSDFQVLPWLRCWRKPLHNPKCREWYASMGCFTYIMVVWCGM